VGCTIDIIALIEETASIDTSRIFATGHSSGAIFTYKLATSTDRFRAIAPTAGLLVHNRIALASDQHPISILEVHGSEDIPVPYSGGGGVPTEQCYSVAETMSAFSKLNGCEPDSKPVPSEEEFLQWEEFPNCTQGLRTAHIRVEGYGHHYKNHGATHR
jgi:poly(3-hydroxybutyrate) depolymerase